MIFINGFLLAYLEAFSLIGLQLVIGYMVGRSHCRPRLGAILVSTRRVWAAGGSLQK